MVRSSKHTLKFCNAGKLNVVQEFLLEYQRVGQLILDHIWRNGCGNFCIQTDHLDLPKYLDYKTFQGQTFLSARALQTLINQVRGIVSSVSEKRRRLLWAMNNLKALHAGKTSRQLKKIRAKLSRALAKTRKALRKAPRFPKSATLNSKCLKVLESKTSFDYYLELRSTGFPAVDLPLKATNVSNLWGKAGTLKGGIVLTEKSATLTFEVEKPEPQTGEEIGADQGLKTVLTCSTGQTTPDTNDHGHSLDSICSKISRKCRGSKAFSRATAHRKNFVNWSINQLNFSGVSKIYLEEIRNINFGKRASRKMLAWTNTLIRDKVLRKAEETGVLVVQQDSTYRSQRCCECGNVRKANRQGKVYCCKHCGNTLDADLNASRNHCVNLPSIKHLRGHKFNLKLGFFWNPDGITTYDGQELVVPDSAKRKIFQ